MELVTKGGKCFGDDPYKITLKDLQMQVKEKLFYKYNFHVPWEVKIRLEKILPIKLKSTYPFCISSNNIAPSEDYNRPIDFIEKQPSKFIDGIDSLIEDLRNIKKKRGISIDTIRNKITEMVDWINKNKFNRKNLNDKLKQYAKVTVSLQDLIEEDDYDYETGKKNNFTEKENIKKLSKWIEEFDTYIVNNSKLIPNYGIRYYYGNIISTAFVESTVNEVISKRMVKNQQIRWTKQGAHLLLQLRIKNLNHEFREHFSKWYSSMKECNLSYKNTLKEVA